MGKDCFLSDFRARRILASILLSGAILGMLAQNAMAERRTSPEFEQYAMRLRQAALLKINRHVILSPSNLAVSSGNGFQRIAGASSLSSPSFSFVGGSGWKTNITTTVFWVGEQAAEGNPVPNDKSAWDGGWYFSYGGYDNPNPSARANFIPANFLPRQNPFYVALPYNDVEDHRTKPEAARVIPWFKSAFVRDGQSVCKGRWVAIRHGNKVAYAQWEDVGPFVTDHWQYVFGNERPRPNRNRDAGLDVSPAVRDYLGLNGMDVTDWKFVSFRSVPPGPWAIYGENNTFVQLRRQGFPRIASQNNLSR